jgi:hypothetical protein
VGNSSAADFVRSVPSARASGGSSVRSGSGGRLVWAGLEGRFARACAAGLALAFVFAAPDFGFAAPDFALAEVEVPFADAAFFLEEVVLALAEAGLAFAPPLEAACFPRAAGFFAGARLRAPLLRRGVSFSSAI